MGQDMAIPSIATPCAHHEHILTNYTNIWLGLYGLSNYWMHNDVIKWKHFPRYWPFVRRIHRSPVDSPHRGQWRRALMFSLIFVWINGCVNNREAGDLKCNRAHYDVIVVWGIDLHRLCGTTAYKLSSTWNVTMQYMYTLSAYYLSHCLNIPADYDMHLQHMVTSRLLY